MKTTVFFIFLFAWARGQDSNQTVGSLSNVFVFVKNWMQQIEHSKSEYISSLIDKIITDTDISSSNENRKEVIKKPEKENKCTEKNERFPIPGSCDRYIECQNGKAEEKLCPDGLLYKHNKNSDVYPCLYPADVQCPPGSTLQPAQATDVCPNQFGFFKTMDRYNCSSYRICENGIGYEYKCPEGLAFNKVTSRCEWPDRVPECNVEAFIGFKCPDVPNLNHLNVSRGYRSPNDCRIYFSCTNGKPRRLECEEYFGFDETNQNCVPASLVFSCTDEQKYLANKLIRRNPSGKYVLIVNSNDDPYLHSRDVSLSFTPRFKARPKTI